MSKIKYYKRPDTLPKVRHIPDVGELLCIQDLDGTFYPVLILSINSITTKKKTKKHSSGIVTVLIENRVTQYAMYDLKLLPNSR